MINNFNKDDLYEFVHVAVTATILMFLMSIMAIRDVYAAESTEIVVDKSTNTLTLFSNDGVAIFDVITGKPGTPTPSFKTQFNVISINPTWNPAPKSQAHLRKHPEIRSHYGIKTDSSGRFYAPPSEKNPMGKARLELQYLEPIRIHGTSEPELFKTNRRNYSSGCIRVLEIQHLVELITHEPIDWNKSYTIKLPYTINVTVE